MTRRLLLAVLALSFYSARPAGAASTFNKEFASIRVSSAVAQASTGDYPALRIFYIRGSTTVFSATTITGLAWVEEAGVRLTTFTVPRLDVSSITGLSILPINTGGFRMVYSAIGSTGTTFNIFSATSADGLAWANETGARVNAANGLAYVAKPSLAKLASGDWRVFYIQDTLGGRGQTLANNNVFVALSTTQGANFTAGASAVAQPAGEVAATVLTNKKVRLYYTAPPAVGVATTTTVASALSSDTGGATFSVEAGLRLSTGSGLGAISHPFVILTTDTFRWRMHYNFTPFQTPNLSTAAVFSATADAPDPQTASPNLLLKNSGIVPFTITGDIFSTPVAPTVTLSQGGTVINGTGVNRVDDQTLKANFDTTGAPIGDYLVKVTNSNGLTGTLTGAVTLDLPSGSVVLTDNLMRPRLGTRTKIDVTTFDRGRVTVKLLTVGGDLVRTLLDEERGEGTLTLFWDGKTASGATAASGLYLLKANGPKLNILQKIVLIK